MLDAWAFVLAGGRSTRMGQDKAFLEFNRETLLTHALSLARAVTPNVRIVGPTATFAQFADTVEDQFLDHGPLGGIHAALCSSQSDCNLMLAVDMPFAEPNFLGWMLEEARRGGATVTIPRLSTGWQPLCAVYRRKFAVPAEQSLQAGRNKIDALFPQVDVRVVSEGELASLGFSPAMFRNLNTPEDVERARLALQN